MARRKKSYQKGSIKEVAIKGGTVYRLRYRVRNPEGGWTEHTETLRDCPSKKTALKVLDERLRKINVSNGGKAQQYKTVNELLCRAWPNYLAKQRVKGSTRSSWNSIVKKWISPYFGERILEEIDPEDVGSFINYLDSQGLSSKYQVNIYSVLRLVFDVAQLNGYMTANPVQPKIHRPAVGRQKKHTWSIDQAKSLLSAVNPAFRAPLVVLALTGIRAGELLALRWSNIDFLRKRIAITDSLWRGQLVETKTVASNREIGMSDQLIQVLLAHRCGSSFRGPNDFVFCQADGKPIDPDYLRRYGIYPALKAAGIPYVKRFSGCHAFRHLVGSIIHKETGSLKMAQEQLGHSNVGTTGDIYVHTDDEQVDRSARILGNALGISCGKSVVDEDMEKGSIQ
jgi:integrase